MISEMKRITVHGQGTQYKLVAFKIDGKKETENEDKLLVKAGYGGQYIAVIRLGYGEPEIYIDNPGARYAPHSTRSECPVLNAAVAHIYCNFNRMYSEIHIEVEDNYEKNFNELDLTVTPGLQFL